MLSWALFGVALLTLVTVVGYLLTPWLIVHVRALGRHGRLTPLDEFRTAGAAHLIADLVRLTDPDPRPVFLVDIGSVAASAQTFGSRRRPYVLIGAGLLLGLEKEANGSDSLGPFGEVILHELGHIRNRDNFFTYLTISAWRAYIALTSIGYLAAVLISRRAPSAPTAQAAVVLAGLIILVTLNVRAVLRTREYQADASAAFYAQTDRFAVFERIPADRWRDKATAWLRFHPRAARRAAMLQTPWVLYQPSASAAASIGVAVGLIIGVLNATTLGLDDTSWVGLLPTVAATQSCAVLAS
jgi:hypothetical protein